MAATHAMQQEVARAFFVYLGMCNEGIAMIEKNEATPWLLKRWGAWLMPFFE